MSTDAISNERSSILLRAAATADLLDGLLERCLADGPLSPREFEIMTVLSVRGPQPPSELSAVTGVPAPSVSRVTRRLEQAGMLHSSAHPSDRRSLVLELTDAGRDAFAGAQHAFQELYAEVADALAGGLPVAAFGVRRLEWALRVVSGLPTPDPAADNAVAHALHYHGPALSPNDEAEVLDYIEWVRARRRRGGRR